MVDLNFLHNLDAENERLQTELAAERQKSERSNDILLERHAEEERRLRAELARVKGALPDAGLLELAACACDDIATISLDSAKMWATAQAICAAAARIRAVQEARGE